MKTIYELQEHETTNVADPSAPTERHREWIVTKVPGGWIYQSIQTGYTCFVPDNRKEYVTGPG
jgi:hypothetical protein